MVCFTLTGTSEACEIVRLARTTLPDPTLARLVGVVIGYRVAPNPTATIAQAPALLVDVREAVSGGVATGVAQVVPMNYGGDCASTPAREEDVRRMFPVGHTVGVVGRPLPHNRREARQTIVAETNREDFAIEIPDTLERTRFGDLDFGRTDRNSRRLLDEFEFDRAVLGLRASGANERFARLRNIAYYPGFTGMPSGRQLFRELATAAGVSSKDLRELERVFDEAHPK